MPATTCESVTKQSTTILQHKVSYWFLDDATRTMSEATEEHIEKMITKGFNQGEMLEHDDHDALLRGWWEIE